MLTAAGEFQPGVSAPVVIKATMLPADDVQVVVFKSSRALRLRNILHNLETLGSSFPVSGLPNSGADL